MPPNLSLHDVADRSRRHTKLISKSVHGDLSRDVPSPDLAHLIFGQFRRRAMVLGAALDALLHHHVGHIDFADSEEQMRATDARRVVATVADHHAVWDRSALQFVPIAVRSDSSTVDGEDAIALRMASAGPFPTGAEFGTASRAILVDESPKPFLRRGIAGELRTGERVTVLPPPRVMRHAHAGLKGLAGTVRDFAVGRLSGRHGLTSVVSRGRQVQLRARLIVPRGVA